MTLVVGEAVAATGKYSGYNESLLQLIHRYTFNLRFEAGVG